MDSLRNFLRTKRAVALPFPSTQTGASVPRELTRPIAPRHVTTWPMRRMLLERAGPPDPVVDGRRGRRLESPHVDKRGQQHALRCLPPCSAASLLSLLRFFPRRVALDGGQNASSWPQGLPCLTPINSVPFPCCVISEH